MGLSAPRKSTIQTEARRRARERATEFRAREDKLETLAVGFFVAHAAVEAVDAQLDRDVAALRERADTDAANARAEADAAVLAMLALGVSRAEVASRLGIPTRAVPKPSRPNANDTQSQAEHEPDHGDEQHE